MKVELVTSLKRRATEIIRDLNKKHEPVLITEHGKPAAYLIDVQSFQEMTRKTELLEGLARGESAINQGRVVEQREAKERMKKWLA
ncbi:type II toxin-antitoxin system Phd/YefM family antitoxin [Pelagicoccus enzymogenes]|uniref:type II toxin-antitoxin system Phd/YefM family antitoxin n=1 Tax=Pelagicoccus enzymogenes TaxID=2773457 RepID=UPI00280C882E|nr:type II toxin-antitoxin system Phd/YefM family antitoxin [Pelagicoccus enzymogenes]MDQ8200796.1 type II toxin-antitoxin system Phd/YefM family antitoxin [Pelagicoccus enzymogenes]